MEIQLCGLKFELSEMNTLNSSQSSGRLNENEKRPQQVATRFGSNLCAVLNDPRKDRAKVAYLFTKTWGSDFVESAPVSAITSVHAISASKYRNVKFNEFKEHLDSFSAVNFKFYPYFSIYFHFNGGKNAKRNIKHAKNKIDLVSSETETNVFQQQQQQRMQTNELELIPKV